MISTSETLRTPNGTINTWGQKASLCSPVRSLAAPAALGATVWPPSGVWLGGRGKWFNVSPRRSPANSARTSKVRPIHLQSPVLLLESSWDWDPRVWLIFYGFEVYPHHLNPNTACLKKLRRQIFLRIIAGRSPNSQGMRGILSPGAESTADLLAATLCQQHWHSKIAGICKALWMLCIRRDYSHPMSSLNQSTTPLFGWLKNIKQPSIKVTKRYEHISTLFQLCSVQLKNLQQRR